MTSGLSPSPGRPQSPPYLGGLFPAEAVSELIGTLTRIIKTASSILITRLMHDVFRISSIFFPPCVIAVSLLSIFLQHSFFEFCIPKKPIFFRHTKGVNRALDIQLYYSILFLEIQPLYDFFTILSNATTSISNFY